MQKVTRRYFLKAAAAGAAAVEFGLTAEVLAQIPGQRLPQAKDVRVLNPQARVPVSLIIDDSTCLVNMAHFAMPQFAETWPDRAEYKKDWRKMPREIPDAFVRKFGQWCREHGVKGKYSIVPYPSCVGWLDRTLPGWSAGELRDSLDLVRTLMLPDWDIHPEMVTHTRVIDTKTGKPLAECSPRTMENWQWTDGKSVDQLADYLSYALKILKNVDLPCEGITTPGGFGSRVLPELAQATLQSCRDVFRAEIPHYFRHLFTDRQSVAPRVEYASGLEGGDPKCVVSIIGCTGDWFGGWDGMNPGSPDQFITEDLQTGRMVEVIERGEPAIMVCHWPGIYYQGEEIGFRILQEVVRRLHARYDNLIWMKNSEIARYWAAKELTQIETRAEGVVLRAPFACPRYTLAMGARDRAIPKLSHSGKPQTLREVSKPLELKPGTWTRDENGLIVCFDLEKGESRLEVGA
ncbi:MAG: twin-arginine translocation signal domain-containing protein [Pirellulales bacterium]|nr:twin-arginine translocation signal domain-containing protein [Pirellulales bacterium]